MRAYIDSGFHSEIGNNTQSEAEVTSNQSSSCTKYVCDLYKEFSSRLVPKNSTTMAPTAGLNEVPT